MEVMQQRAGSRARKPQESSRSKPLRKEKKGDRQGKCTLVQPVFLPVRPAAHSPHAKHVNQVLFCHVVLLVHIPLQSRKDPLSLQQCLTASLLELQQSRCSFTIEVRPFSSISFNPSCSFGRNYKVLELLTKDDDRLFAKEGIRVLGCIVEGRVRTAVLKQRRSLVLSWLCRSSVKVVLSFSEKGQDVRQALRVELWVRKRGCSNCQTQR